MRGRHTPRIGLALGLVSSEFVAPIAATRIWCQLEIFCTIISDARFELGLSDTDRTVRHLSAPAQRPPRGTSRVEPAAPPSDNAALPR